MGVTISKFLCKMLQNIMKKISSFGATKMVIIVRTDLQMGRGKIASQVAHAAVSLYQISVDTSNPHLKPWLRFGQPKIVLKIDQDCEEKLQCVYESAKSKNLTACKICDAGKTQVDTGTLTAVGIGPNSSEEIDKITSGFKLL